MKINFLFNNTKDSVSSFKTLFGYCEYRYKENMKN